MRQSKLKSYRKARNIKQKSLAMRLGVSPIWLSYIENGARVPSTRLCRLIEQVTNGEVTFNDLIPPIDN